MQTMKPFANVAIDRTKPFGVQGKLEETSFQPMDERVKVFK